MPPCLTYKNKQTNSPYLYLFFENICNENNVLIKFTHSTPTLQTFPLCPLISCLLLLSSLALYYLLFFDKQLRTNQCCVGGASAAWAGSLTGAWTTYPGAILQTNSPYHQGLLTGGLASLREPRMVSSCGIQ